MDFAAIIALLKLVAPGLGALVQKNPYVSNKLIPAILTLYNTVVNWWIIAELPTEVLVPAVDPVAPAMAGFFSFVLDNPISQGLVAVAVGRFDAYLNQNFYRARKYRGIVKG